MAVKSSGTIISQGGSTSIAVVVPLIVVAVFLLSAVFVPRLVVEVSRGDFALVSVFLGGGAAWLSGRSIAKTWRGYRQAVLYALLLGCVVRFFHFALFFGTLLSLHYFITDTAFLIAVTTLGFRAERSKQMATRYSWLYHKSGPFGWRQGAAAKASGDTV